MARGEAVLAVQLVLQEGMTMYVCVKRNEHHYVNYNDEWKGGLILLV